MKHYIITRLTERDEDLRARYLANEEFFAEALGPIIFIQCLIILVINVLFLQAFLKRV